MKRREHHDRTEFSRRNFLQTASAGTALLALNAAGARRLLAEDSSGLLGTAKDAYIWGFPLVYTVQLLRLAKERNAPVNQFVLSTRLSTPADKVAGPNVDTLYGFAWLNLSREPQILHVPDTKGRYYSIQLVDAYGNTFTYVGRRVTGTAAGRYAIVGPHWNGSVPSDVKKINAPTDHVLALTRTLVSGEADLPAAQAVQIQYGLQPLSAYPKAPPVPLTNPAALNIFPILHPGDRGLQFFDDLGSGLSADAPPSSDHAVLDRFGKLGIGPSKDPSQSQDQAVIATLRDAIPAADAEIHKADFSTRFNGWSVNYKIEPFIKDPLLRASTNLYGPGAHVAQEALYFNAQPDGKALLSGANKYSLKFPANGLPPVDAFWSLTLYGADYALVENPIHRYSIGDRTPGLKYGPDGSLELLVQHEQPAEGASNWLPAPAGQFQVTFRTYQPRPAIFNGEYKLPPFRKL
jgi:hypothetical protein